MRFFLFTFIALILSLSLNATEFEKVIFDPNAEVGYYLAVTPKVDKIEGVLLLLPGFGQLPESIFPETGLPQVAADNGLLTIALGFGSKLYADKATIKRLNTALSHVVSKYELADVPFAVGGFSAGGTISLRYAEHCHENPSEAPLLPRAVFSVDGPVDLFGIWEYFEREIAKDYSDAGVREAKYVMNIMQSEIGTPESDRANYEKLTPFHIKAKTPGNEKYLRDIAVRVYHDVDVDWLLRERRRSLQDCNAFASSEMINRLILFGNERAEFVQATGQGRRSSAERHPHSWSIINAEECVVWLKGIFKQS